MSLDVVVCAKNMGSCLKRVLKQIRQQVPHKNLIVVYGSSFDDTKQVAQRYADTAVWDGDLGLGAARALGVALAKSEIVAMIDADVILTPDWYKQLIVHFKNPKIAAVMGTCVYGYGCKPLEAYWEYYRQTQNVNWGCQNTMLRRQAVLQVGNFDANIRGAGEDYDLYMRLRRAGYEWIWEKQASAYHPMTLPEYLQHVSWWSRGKPYVEEMAQWAKDTSLHRVYMRQMLFAFESFGTAEKLSVKAHPTLLLYWPIMRINSLLVCLKELKEHSKHKKQGEPPQLEVNSTIETLIESI